MLTIGLTGSTGSGKGFICAIFEENGIPCLDTDAVSRKVYLKGNACYDELVKAFGEGILDGQGEIDRKKLGKAAFQSNESYLTLTDIAYKHIMNYTTRWLKEQQAAGYSVAVVDAPMLFESGFDGVCNKVVSVISDRETQIARAMERDHITEAQVLARLDRQNPNRFYEAKSDYVLDNSDTNKDNIRSDARKLAVILKRLSVSKKANPNKKKIPKNLRAFQNGTAGEAEEERKDD